MARQSSTETAEVLAHSRDGHVEPEQAHEVENDADGGDDEDDHAEGFRHGDVGSDEVDDESEEGQRQDQFNHETPLESVCTPPRAVGVRNSWALTGAGDRKILLSILSR